MAQIAITDVRALVLESESFGSQEAETLREILANDASAVSRLREVVQILRKKEQTASGAELTRIRQRLGLVEYMLGWPDHAIAHLSKVTKDGLAQFYLGRALLVRGDAAGAVQAFERAAENGYDRTIAELCKAGAIRAQGKVDEAIQMIRSMEQEAAATAEYHYQLGCCLEDKGERDEAIKHFERALDIDPQHPEALFKYAYYNDLYGNDDEAIQLYERCLARAPVHLGALFNLGVLYEDRGLYDRAARCYQRVLSIYPSHARAKLFLKDCMESHQVLQEEQGKQSDRLAQLLATPVTDFELSVRSRNCLQRMNIRTLRDLVNTTEEELLKSKNFGETSLEEIRQLLAAKGLRIGMFAEKVATPSFVIEEDELTEAEREAMDKPISELKLTARSNKCMQKLGITTIGQLMQYTADQLLEVKNFGMTSLNEVRRKLSEMGLKLKGD